MKLFTRTGATSVQSGETTHTVAADLSIEVPDELATILHNQHDDKGDRTWETEAERFHRVLAEDAARRSDPATLLAAVEQLRLDPTVTNVTNITAAADLPAEVFTLEQQRARLEAIQADVEAQFAALTEADQAAVKLAEEQAEAAAKAQQIADQDAADKAEAKKKAAADKKAAAGK